MIPSRQARKNGKTQPARKDGLSSLARFRRFMANHTDEWVMLGLAGFLFLVATNTQTGWLYVVVALLIGVLVAGFLGPRATLKGLEVRRRMPAPAALGDEVRIEIEVRNPGKGDRLLVTLEDTLPDSLPGETRTRRFLIERIPAGGAARISYRVPCTLRGYHDFGPVKLRTGTPLGLFPVDATLEAGAEPLVIYPRGPRLLKSPVSSVNPRKLQQNRTQPRAGASEDFHGLRPYTLGEDIRFVHWPATARTGEMMIREFRETGGQSVAVLVDNGADANYGSGAESNLEVAISAAASLADYARRNNMPLTLLTERDGHVDARRKVATEAALDFLARVQAEGRLSWSDLLAEASRHVPADCHLFLLATRPLVEAKDLQVLAQRRIKVTVVLFPAPLYHTNGRALAPGLERESYERSVRALTGSGYEVRTHPRDEDLATTLQRGGPR